MASHDAQVHIEVNNAVLTAAFGAEADRESVVVTLQHARAAREMKEYLDTMLCAPFLPRERIFLYRYTVSWPLVSCVPVVSGLGWYGIDLWD
jgi:hypothetical protein